MNKAKRPLTSLVASVLIFWLGLLLAFFFFRREPGSWRTSQWQTKPIGEQMFGKAPKIPHRIESHGDVRTDDYYWMRERDTQPVLDYLTQENRRTAEAMATVKGLEESLYREMRARVNEEDASVPVFDRGYDYYWRFQKGQEYPLHCRRRGSLEANEEIILDENAEAKGKGFFAVDSLEVSPDQKIMAYAVDTVGRRIYDIRFKDLSTGKSLPDSIQSVTPNFVWAQDNKTIFYVRQDPETLRFYQLYRYELGSHKPVLIYEEKDTTFSVGVETAKTHQFIFMTLEKRDSFEYRILDANNPKGEFRVFLPREPKHEYILEDGGDRFYVLTNDHAKNFRLMEAPHSARGKSEWREVIPHNPQILLEGVDVNEKFFVLSEREKGLTQLRVVARDGKASRLLSFPDPAYEVYLRSLPDYRGTSLRFEYESLVQPASIWEEDYLSEKRVLRKNRDVLGYDKTRYETQRQWAIAKDGTRIPVTLVMRKGTKRDGQNPLLLYAYGSYGSSAEIYFQSTVLSLLDRGFVYAIAHVRGGSELGREWYEQGKMFHKKNTFTDFIAVAEFLAKEGYTAPDHLYAMGASAGGLLIGAVINTRPDLFKGAVAGVPFVDIMTTMMDDSIPLTTNEYNEWGDPRIKEQYEYMRSYSPYDNVERKAYPNLLVTTGYHDSQVQYWEPAKWVAKLRDLKTDQNLLLLFTEMEAGHSGASGRFEALKTLAKEYAFILMLEGITK